jgi:cyclase
MLETRVIPCLQLVGQSLVKSVQFKRFNYIGDPVNTVRIFNELEVDELCFLGIRTSATGQSPEYSVLREIADECFMPLSYGGGIRTLDEARKILSIGFEKVVINTAATENVEIVREISNYSGSQSVIASIDVRKNFVGQYTVWTRDGSVKTNLDPVSWAVELVGQGAGELLITSMDRDGTWQGYDLNIIRAVSKAVTVPIIASGGAGSLHHLIEAKEAGASALALGSMVVYQKKGMGVLINMPDRQELDQLMCPQ